MGDGAGKDVFISCASVDRGWAEWIATELERAGFTTVVQPFDFRPGTDFLHRMHHAVTTAERTLAVLSPAYLTSAYGEAEWRAAFARDPSGDRRLLIPVRIAPCEPVGLLAARVYVDLVGVSEVVARKKLLAAFDRDRDPRDKAIPFPGAVGALPPSGPGAPFPGPVPSPAPGSPGAQVSQTANASVVHGSVTLINNVNGDVNLG